MISHNLRCLKALIIKETVQIVRDPSAILISVILPILLIFLYAYGVSLDLDHLRIGLVLEEMSPDVMSLSRSFTNSRYFEVTLARDRRELLKPLERGKIRGIVVVPAYFSQFRRRATSLFVDNSAVNKGGGEVMQPPPLAAFKEQNGQEMPIHFLESERMRRQSPSADREEGRRSVRSYTQSVTSMYDTLLPLFQVGNPNLRKNALFATGMSNKGLNPHWAPIQVIADGSETNTANFVQNYVSATVANWIQQEAISSALRGLPKISVQPRFWFNEQLESRYFLLPGSLSIIMTLIGILLTALVVAREWERGTMEGMMATPVSIAALTIGKIIPYFFLGLFSMALCFLLTVFGFHIPFRGSLLLLLLVAMVFLFCALSLGLMISTLSKNQLVAFQVAVIVGFLPAYILSGFLFEISSMPPPIRLLTNLIPARYFVVCLQTLFLVGNVGRLIIANIIPMLCMSAVFLLITIRKTVKRLD